MQIILVLALFFYRAYFTNYKNHSYRDSNAGQFFVVVAFVSLISPPIQTTFVSELFFYRAHFPSYKNHFHQDSNPGQSFGAVAFLKPLPDFKA
jgi:hypothetical protein